MKVQKVIAGMLAAVCAVPLICQSDFRADAVSDCVIVPDTAYQTIQGFGGINLPEWTGSDLTDAQVQKAFGNGEDELGLSILRVYVNDNSDLWYKAVPVAKKAQALGAVVFATPWNPPESIRINGDGTLTGGKYQLDKNKWAEYASHLNSFVKYMENQGVDLYSISVQNEPDYAEDWTYWSTADLTDFIAQYGSAVTAGTNAKLMSPESFQYKKEIYNSILNNSQAFNNIGVFGTHFYGTARSDMDFPALENSGKPIWMTEVYVPNSSSDADTWPEAIDVAENIHNGLVVGNLNAYTWWYIRRSYGPIKEDGSISKRGYCMAQYSKFVRPGDMRVEVTEQPNTDVYVSAYKNNDKKVTVVAVNKGNEYVQHFTMPDETMIDVDRYRTSADENLSLTENMEIRSDSSFYATLPANSVSTFVITLKGGELDNFDENGYFFHDDFENSTCDWNAVGDADVLHSGRTAYAGSEALLIENRTAAWNGAVKSLGSALKAGESYSFSVNTMYFDGDDTDEFFLKLKYTDANGTERYSTIASGTAGKGEWVQLANTSFTLPSDAKTMQLLVETSETVNNFYIDEAIAAKDGIVIEGAGQAEMKTKKGDVNADGTFNVADVVLFQKWLLAVPNTHLADWKAADFCEDDVLNVFDLCLMKRELLKK